VIPERGAFRTALRAALGGDARADGVRFAAPLVTAIVADADAGPLPVFAPLLAESIDALAAAGIPRGRQFVLFVRTDGGLAEIERSAWREVLGVPVLVHDPAGTTFRVRATAPAVDLDDELREAEAIVTIGPAASAADRFEGGPLLLCPGAAGPATVAEWRRRRDTDGLAGAIAFSLEVERHAPVDLAVTWDPSGRVIAAAGATAFAALARAAGWA
jgi:hypothetical protein